MPGREGHEIRTFWGEPPFGEKGGVSIRKRAVKFLQTLAGRISNQGLRITVFGNTALINEDQA